MLSCRPFVLGLSAILLANVASGLEHRVEPLNEKPPADALSKEILSELSDAGVRVIRGKKTTLCDIWLCKQWPVGPPSKKADIVYPFKQGQLIGVVRFGRSSKDFKDQKISKGVYTMRYALQPTDGNHIGTFATKDFVLLMTSKRDKKLAAPKLQQLIESSAEAAQSAHPALLCLLKSKAKKTPAIRHEANSDWWVAQIASKANADDKTTDLVIDLVVVGHASE